MSAQTSAEVLEDLRAYIGTLDPAEALGEAVHVARACLNSARYATRMGAPGELAQARAASIALPIVLDMLDRAVTAGAPAADPEESGGCSCSFLIRLHIARLTGS